MPPAAIKSVRIRGFRSLADVALEDLPQATVLIGANGSGKSNFIRFFEMLSWMLGKRRLGEFVERQGEPTTSCLGVAVPPRGWRPRSGCIHLIQVEATINLLFLMLILIGFCSVKRLSDFMEGPIRRSMTPGYIWIAGTVRQ